MFQDFALLPWANVMRNVAFGLELRGVARSEREDIARKYIEEVGLGGFEGSYPHELSGGMRQRVGLARALCVDAQVLLMDEPFSAVDEQTRRKFQEDLLSLVQTERKTFIFVTHSIEEAVYVLGSGGDPAAAAEPGPRRSSGRASSAPRASATSGAIRNTSTSSTGSGRRCAATWNEARAMIALRSPPARHVVPDPLGAALGDRRPARVMTFFIPPL